MDDGFGPEANDYFRMRREDEAERTIESLKAENEKLRTGIKEAYERIKNEYAYSERGIIETKKYPQCDFLHSMHFYRASGIETCLKILRDECPDLEEKENV